MMKNNNIQFWNKKRFWTALVVVQFFLVTIIKNSQLLISAFEYWFEFQKEIHLKLFSWIPFSIGDLFYGIAIIYLVYQIFRLFNPSTRKHSLLNILKFFNIAYFTYQIFWGLLYFQKPIADSLDGKPIENKELKELTLYYLQRCKTTRAMVQENKQGVFSIENLEKVKDDILQQQRLLPSFIMKKNLRSQSIKKGLIGKFMNYTGILGYYNPFTAELQYNPHLPHTSLPMTLAHESSHQMGYAREEEANFVGYLIGINSTNKDLKYSTEWFTLQSLLNALYDSDPQFCERILKHYSDGMKRDRKHILLYREKYQGWIENLLHTTNDWFLKSNQQDGSITYSYFVELLVKYHRKQ